MSQSTVYVPRVKFMSSSLCPRVQFTVYVLRVQFFSSKSTVFPRVQFMSPE